MNKIDPKYIDASISYDAYREMIDKLLSQQKTTGTNHSEDMIHYTKMNVTRMKRLDKTTVISESLQKAVASVSTKMIWLVITEAWCGDAAQIVPVLNKIAELNPNIEIRFILRDEHLELMDQYLTNGGRSIPKVIAIDESTNKEIFNWGPRPAGTQELFLKLKAEHENYMDVAEGLHRWYAKDKTLEIQKEFTALLGDK